MRVEALAVCHFRNLQSQKIEFSAGINELIGKNAEGKTSVLEALHMLILGSSFRTHQLSDMIQHGASGFFIEVIVNIDGVQKKLRLTYDGSRRNVIVDDQYQETSSALLGNLLGVTATLEDRELIFGPPSIRRRFLDEQIAQINTEYVKMLKNYRKALSYRNLLLKKQETRTISAWEEQLSIAGAYLVKCRKSTVEQLSPYVEKTFHTLFPEMQFPFCMSYQTQYDCDDLKEWYVDQYAKRREHEMRVGSTLTGPHRDDLAWIVGNRPFKAAASLGQARCAALALRFAEWELLSKRSEDRPIFLIDDAESTLDTSRKQSIMRLCAQFPQVVLTSHERTSLHGDLKYVRQGSVCSK